MTTWIAANLPTILISVGLAAVVSAIIIRMLKNKKQGKSSCGGGCGGCAMSGTCHDKK